jgi:hypothetical protein
MKKKILFLSTLNLATNPRLVKEIRLASHLNYDITVICFKFNNWSNELNDKLLAEFKNVLFIQIDGERTALFSWLTSSISEKICRVISRLFLLPSKFLADAVSRRSSLLTAELKKISTSDLVIGHNPGAIFATYKAAQKFKCKAGFDVEDYHPGEGEDRHLQSITMSLMKKLLPEFDYVSFASESILKECKKHIPFQSKQSLKAIINSFPPNEFNLPAEINDKKLKFVWFSQHINSGRGLEKIIPVISKHADKVSLTLFGNCNQEFYHRYIDAQDGLILGEVLDQSALHHQLSYFDVGLALEDITIDKNRDVCLTNKVCAYYQSGLYIIASATTEQNSFLERKRSHGAVYKTIKEFESELMKLIVNIDFIRQNKSLRYKNALSDSWEAESLKLTELWEGHHK